MSLTILGKGIGYLWFGLMPVKPRLPDGWEYYEDANDWLLAKSPDGKWWFVGTDEAARCKWAGVWDKIRTLPNLLKGEHPFRIGTQYSDSRERITL